MSAPAPLSFRLSLQEATEESLAVASARLQAERLPAKLLPDVEAQLAEMSRARLSPRRLSAWLLHPDERVGVAAIQRIERTQSTDANREYRQLALARALERCVAEGVYWNPLLDALDARALLPDSRHNWPLSLPLPPEGAPLSPELTRNRASAALAVEELRRQLARAISQDPEGTALGELLKTQSPALLKRVAELTKPVPDSLVEASRARAVLVPALLTHAALTPEQLSRIRLDVLSALHEGRATYGHTQQTQPTARLVVEFVKAKKWGAQEAVDTLLSRLPRERPAERYLSYFHSSLVDAVCRIGGLNAEQLRRLGPYQKDVHWLSEWLASVRGTPLEILRELARARQDEVLFKLMKNHPQATADPEVAANLPGSGIPSDCWQGLLQYSHGPALRFAVQQSLKSNARSTLVLLARRMSEEEVRASLFGADFAPAFASTDPGVRETALRLVGQVQQGSAPMAKRKPRRV